MIAVQYRLAEGRETEVFRKDCLVSYGFRMTVKARTQVTDQH